jgi:catechol 2,3-dioxygenase-like lactoylglutathione lyase family enzyme
MTHEIAMSVMIDHISIGVRDIEAAKTFYDAVLRPLGIKRLYQGADFAAYGTDDKDDLSIHQGGEGWCPDPKVHIAFSAASREAVEASIARGSKRVGSTTARRRSARTMPMIISPPSSRTRMGSGSKRCAD